VSSFLLISSLLSLFPLCVSFVIVSPLLSFLVVFSLCPHFRSVVSSHLISFVSGVLSVFPVLEEASAVAERFEASAVLPPLAPQDALFQLLLPDLQVPCVLFSSCSLFFVLFSSVLFVLVLFCSSCSLLFFFSSSSLLFSFSSLSLLFLLSSLSCSLCCIDNCKFFSLLLSLFCRLFWLDIAPVCCATELPRAAKATRCGALRPTRFLHFASFFVFFDVSYCSQGFCSSCS
jgi:hypothetical protein